MISPGSLSAFSSTGAASPLRGTQASDPAGPAQRVRAQSASPAATIQAQPKSLPGNPDKPLPRGSLLNLQV